MPFSQQVQPSQSTPIGEVAQATRLQREQHAERQVDCIRYDEEEAEDIQTQTSIHALLAELTEMQRQGTRIPASCSQRHEHFVVMQEEESDNSDDDIDEEQMDMDHLLLMELEELLERHIKEKQ
jgi:hypothetical protein